MKENAIFIIYFRNSSFKLQKTFLWNKLNLYLKRPLCLIIINLLKISLRKNLKNNSSYFIEKGINLPKKIPWNQLSLSNQKHVNQRIQVKNSKYNKSLIKLWKILMLISINIRKTSPLRKSLIHPIPPRWKLPAHLKSKLNKAISLQRKVKTHKRILTKFLKLLIKETIWLLNRKYKNLLLESHRIRVKKLI